MSIQCTRLYCPDQPQRPTRLCLILVSLPWADPNSICGSMSLLGFSPVPSKVWCLVPGTVMVLVPQLHCSWLGQALFFLLLPIPIQSIQGRHKWKDKRKSAARSSSRVLKRGTLHPDYEYTLWLWDICFITELWIRSAWELCYRQCCGYPFLMDFLVLSGRIRNWITVGSLSSSGVDTQGQWCTINERRVRKTDTFSPMVYGVGLWSSPLCFLSYKLNVYIFRRQGVFSLLHHLI